MPDVPDNPLAETRELTRLESAKEIRDVIEVRRAQKAAGFGQGKLGAGPSEPEVEPYRPVLRPPMALLIALDDGRADGEIFRLRCDLAIIGRTEGEIRIPHDFQVSGRHAEIVRHKAAAGYRWTLTDLQSTNGTFVRVGSTVLHPGSELLIGSGRYRFEGGADHFRKSTESDTPPVGEPGIGNPVHSLVPSLVELAPSGPVQRHRLTLPEYWIGRDANACAIARPDDVLVSPRHARLFRNASGLWLAENNGSLNGL